MTHRLEIPYIFTVSGIPKRGKNERKSFCFEFAPLGVEDVDARDAPVAAEWTASFTEAYPSDDGTVTLRQYDGRLYAKDTVEGGNHERVPVTIELVERFLAAPAAFDPEYYRLRKVLGNEASTLRRGLAPEPNDGNPIIPFVERNWDRIVSSDRNAKLAELAKRFDGLIVIGGELWKQVAEPRYAVVRDRLGRDQTDHTSVHIVDPQSDKSRNYAPNTLYSITAWDRMAAEVMEKYGAALDEKSRVEVHIPDAFGFDDFTEKVLAPLSSALNYDGDLLRSMPVKAMVAWADFRDSHRAFGAAQATGSAAAIEDAMAGLVEAAGIYAAHETTSQKARGDIARATDLWDTRPVAVSDVGHAPRTPR